MPMLDISDLIPIGFLFKMLFGAALFILAFWAVPYLMREINDSYKPWNARAGYFILTLGLIIAPLGIWYNTYVNCPFYDIFPLSFLDFCILLIIGVPVLYGLIYWYEMSNRG